MLFNGMYLFLQAAHDWEVEVVMAFFGMLYALRQQTGGEDCIWWTPSVRKKFEVWLFRVLSTSTASTLGVSFFPWRSIWRLKVQLRVSFFV
jgi:hypothetical protein